jgi:hypothetical protein
VDRASLCGILRHSNVTHAEPLLAAKLPVRLFITPFNVTSGIYYIMLRLVGKPKLKRLL